MKMKTSNTGIAFIKRHEGYRDKAYQCSAGRWTIGYGHTLGVKQGDAITPAQAEAYLAADLAKYEAAVNAASIKGLNQPKFDALVSLAYNIGVAAFNSSTLLKKAKANVCDVAIRNEFMRFVYVRKQHNKGLYSRRAAEANMYFSL
jgi:lysozyme